MEVKAKLKDQDAATVVNYNFGDNLEGMRALFGDEVVFNKALDALVIDCQSNVRRLIKKGKSQAEIQAEIDKWKPSTVSAVRKSAAEKVQDLVGQLTPDQKKELLAQLKKAA